MIPVLPILGLAATVVPDIVKWIAGDSAGEVAEQVSNVALEVFGTTDKDAAELAIAKDPNLALQFKIKVTEIANEHDKREHEYRIAELKYAAEDVQSARNSYIQHHDQTLPRLAMAVAVMFLFMIGTVLYGIYGLVTKGLGNTDPNLMMAVSATAGSIITMVSSKFDTVINFYFGSSVGSKAKDNLGDNIAKFLAKK